MPIQSVMGAVPRLFLVGALLWAGCHADDNDPKGQAEELEDPVRREHAVGRLQAIFSQRLVETKGDRSAQPLQDFADVTAEALNKTFLAHPEDSVNGLRMLGLMQEIRDPRTLPALLTALDWKLEVSEEHAISAARTLAMIEIPADKKSEVVAALSKALSRVDGARGLDNRMRKTFIETLGELKDPGAVEVLVETMLNQDKDQSFLFNILAGQQLVGMADPNTTQSFIKALYICDPENPAMRMNDVAASGLAAIGKPALQPVLDTLAGKNEEANETAKLYIEAVRQKDPDIASKLSVSSEVAREAAYTLGKLGYREAVEPLIEEAHHSSVERASGAALALVSINREESDTRPILKTLTDVYDRLEPMQQPQLLVAMRHLYADESMPFFLQVAEGGKKGRGKRGEPQVSPSRLYGFVSYAMLADKEEAQNLKAVMASSSGLADLVKDYQSAIAAAEACDRDVDCWVGKLADKDTVVVRKAADMLARLARGEAKATEKLVSLFGHSDLEVRNEALFAVDYMATQGSKPAVEKIEALQREEEGRSIWNGFKREALPIRARLLARSQS